MSDSNKKPTFAHLAYMLGLYSNKTIPQTYIGEFSNYELLLSLMNKVNEIIQRTTEYDDIMKEIQALLDDIDDTIREEVERILQQMYDDGEFAGIIAEIFENVTAPKEFKIDTRREFRICRPVMPYNATTVSGEWYSFCQGGKMFKRNNTLYYVACMKIARSDNSYYNNNLADVRVYRFNTLDGKWEFYNHNIYPLGHANDICYVEPMDSFIVAHATDYESTLQTNLNNKKFTIIDFSLPNDTSVTLTNENIFSDEERAGITCIDFYDGKLWFGRGAGASTTIIKIDTIDVPENARDDYNWLIGVPEQYVRFNVPVTAGTPYVMVMAGMCQNENYIFLGNTAPCGIYRFNKTTKQIDCFYEIGSKTNADYFPTGEMENLSCIDDIIYIGASVRGNQELYYYCYTQVFSFDFINNTRVPNQIVTTYGGTYRVINVGTQHYTLDAQNNKVYAYDKLTINPDMREISNPNGMGGANGEPFPTWEEAILHINAQNLWDTITIRQQTRYMVEYVCINSSKNIFIDGATFYNSMSSYENEAERYARVGGLYIDGTNIIIDHMWIQNLSPLNLTAYATHQIFIRNSNATIHNCVFYVTGRSGLGQVYDNNLISFNRGFGNILNLRPITYSDNEFHAGNKYVLSTLEGNGTSSNKYRLKYMNCYVCTINAMGDYVKGEHTGANTGSGAETVYNANTDRYFILS